MREAPAEITEWDEHLIHQHRNQHDSSGRYLSSPSVPARAGPQLPGQDDKLLIRFRNGVVVEQALGALEAAA